MKRFKWDKHYLYWGITAFCVIVCSIVFFLALNYWRSVGSVLSLVLGILSPFIYGLIIAYLLTPVVKWFERSVFNALGARVFPKKPKKAAVFVRVTSLLSTLLLSFLIVGLLLLMLLPELLNSLESLFRNMSSYINIAINYIEALLERLNNPEFEEAAVDTLNQITSYFSDWLQTSLIPQLNTILTSVSTGVISFLRTAVNVLIGIVISVYILYNREIFAAQTKKFLYSILKPLYVKNILQSLTYVDNAFGGFFLGKMLDSAIVGVICLVFLSLFNMPYAVLISVVIAVTNMIPFFGPFIGAVPSAFLLLMESPTQCLIFIIFIIILQQIDGNVLGPKILSGTTGLSGFWVMFAILVGGGLFGFIGMICGVPALSVIYALVKSVCDKRLKQRELPVETREYMQLSYIDPETRLPVKKSKDPEESGSEADAGK